MYHTLKQEAVGETQHRGPNRMFSKRGYLKLGYYDFNLFQKAHE